MSRKRWLAPLCAEQQSRQASSAWRCELCSRLCSARSWFATRGCEVPARDHECAVGGFPGGLAHRRKHCTHLPPLRRSCDPPSVGLSDASCPTTSHRTSRPRAPSITWVLGLEEGNFGGGYIGFGSGQAQVVFAPPRAGACARASARAALFRRRRRRRRTDPSSRDPRARADGSGTCTASRRRCSR
jgi:hypothetical protein